MRRVLSADSATVAYSDTDTDTNTEIHLHSAGTTRFSLVCLTVCPVCLTACLSTPSPQYVKLLPCPLCLLVATRLIVAYACPSLGSCSALTRSHTHTAVWLDIAHVYIHIYYIYLHNISVAMWLQPLQKVTVQVAWKMLADKSDSIILMISACRPLMCQVLATTTTTARETPTTTCRGKTSLLLI